MLNNKLNNKVVSSFGPVFKTFTVRVITLPKMWVLDLPDRSGTLSCKTPLLWNCLLLSRLTWPPNKVNETYPNQKGGVVKRPILDHLTKGKVKSSLWRKTTPTLFRDSEHFLCLWLFYLTLWHLLWSLVGRLMTFGLWKSGPTLLWVPERDTFVITLSSRIEVVHGE